MQRHGVTSFCFCSWDNYIDDQQEQEEFLQLLLLEKDAIEDDIVYYAQIGAAVILYGVEVARHIRSERHYEWRLYLTRPELLPDPQLAAALCKPK